MLTDPPRLRFSFIKLISLGERVAVSFVQIRHFVRAKECPILIVLQTLHEQVRNPRSGMHVVGSSSVVASVFAEIQEFNKVQMPRFHVRTHGSFAFSALVHRNGSIVDDFQERNHSLAFAVGPLDSRTGRTNIGPVVAKTTGPLR